MTTSLQDLPTELLAKILCSLDVRGLASISMTNMHLHEVYISSLPFVYKAALCNFGRVDRSDTPSGTVRETEANQTVEEKLLRLMRQEESWTNLHSIWEGNRFTIDGIRWSSTMVADLDVGVLALGENTVDYCETVMYFDLCERIAVTGKVHNRVDEVILLAIALSLRDYDLIALVDEELEVVRLLQLSSGLPHPLAKLPCIPLPEICEEYRLAKIRVAGQHLLIRLCIDGEKGLNMLLLLNWWSGELIATKKLAAERSCEFAYVSHDLVLCASAPDNSLLLIHLPVGHESGQQRRIETRLVLRLPDLKSDLTYVFDQQCCCKPDLFGEVNADGGNVRIKQWGRSSGFVHSPQDAVIHITFTVARQVYPHEDSEEGRKDFALVVHRSSLAGLLGSHPPLYASKAACLPQILEWEEWGASIAHIYAVNLRAWGRDNDPLPSEVWGQRLVLGNREEIIIRDFNPYNVQTTREQLRFESCSVASGITSDLLRGETDSTTSHSTITVVDGRQTLTDDDTFQQPVTFALPYVETVKKGNFAHLKGFLLGEDCVIGIHHKNDSSTDALHAIDIFPIE